MRVFLLFLVSSLLALSALWASPADAYTVGEGSALRRYTVQVETPKGGMSGVMLAKETDEQINGSLINEFGVSAIDFTYSKKDQKLKLLGVASFLDKWYIKMVLKKDLRFCVHTLWGIPYKSKHNYEVVRSGETTSITNRKRGLKYRFTPLTI